MTEEIKGAGVPEGAVIRLLEQQSKYGIDQETMLLYISSINLMSILSLIGRRYGGNISLSLPAPAPALPPLPQGAAPGNGPPLDNLVGSLMKMLGNQGGGNAPGGQGLNPAMLMSMLSALGGQNMDLGGLMSMLAGLMGSGAKPAPGPAAPQPASSSTTNPSAPGVKESGAGTKTAGEEKAAREVPKIMKWDHLEERKKA